MGDQPLYQVTASVVDATGAMRDQKTFNIGLRTIDIDRTHLKEGSRFCIRVNGRTFSAAAPISARTMSIFARITDAKYEKLVAEAKNANMTMFRINGVSIFEAPAFYDACDRAGILIFHDFPFTCSTYPDDDAGFREAVRAETESAVRLLRHHPSIALWSGSNECIMGPGRLVERRPEQAADLGRVKALQPGPAGCLPAHRPAAAVLARQPVRRRRPEARLFGRLPLVVAPT